VAIALPLRSEETPPAAAKTNDKKPVPSPAVRAGSVSDGNTTPLAAKKVDWSSLPADAVLVIRERGSDDLLLPPNAIILSPSKYQEMRDEIERLKKQLQTDNPAPPTRCDLRGKVETAAVRLEAEFSGTAEHANTLVTLACPQAGAASAQTDGRMALIRRSESGDFLVRIEKAGEYHVKLELVLPLTTREGNGRGVELTLPRATITNLELDLPANSKDVRFAGRTLDDARLAGLTLKNHHLSGNPGLDPVDKLDLSWKEARAATGDLVRTADGRIRVQVDAAGVTTEADLLLKVSGPPTNVWRLLVPLGAEVQVKSAKEDGLKATIKTTDSPKSFVSTRTIDLKEASAEPLEVHVKVRVPLPRSGSVVPIGPFFVVDAARQTGTVVVRNQVRNLHLEYRGHGDMQLRRQQPEEASGDTSATVATLVYNNIPLVANAKEPTGPQSPSWLDLAAETVHAHLKTRVSHTLTLQPASSSPIPGGNKGERTLHWDILTTLAPAPKGIEGEPLKIVVPPQWQSSDERITVVPNSNPRCAMIPASLLREGFKLAGRYELPENSERRALIKLPRPQGTIEQCEVKIEAPAEYEIVLHNAADANLEAAKPQRPNEQTWRCRNVPADGPSLDLGWRPYRPELRVSAVVDVTLNGARAKIRHEMKLQLPAAPPAFVDLRVPAGVADSLTINDSRPQAGRDNSGAPETIRIPVPARAAGTEWRLLLDYSTRLGVKDRPPLSDESFPVPLVTLEQATAGDVKARVWSDAGSLPRAGAASHWEERGIEEVKDRSALPVLVLHAARLDVPLVLRARAEAARFAVLVERSLVRVQLLEGGVQHWRASFQLRQLAGRTLDILMPGPVATLNAQFLLNRRQVTPDLVNEEGEHTDGGNVARLHLSAELIRQTALLDVSFQALPGRGVRSPLYVVLYPPRIRGAPAVPTRWLVSMPTNRVLLSPESEAGVERTWTRRGWLLAARLQRNAADLQREFEESLPAELRHDGEAAALAAGYDWTPALVCWQDHTAPLVVAQVPQQGWLLMCSLGLLIVGLGLYWAARPRAGNGGRMAAWFWPLLAGLTLTAAIALLFWPTTLWAILYGCEPGAVVLLGVLALQWTVYQRYRRQIVFLPSFSRGRAGSSLLRKTSSHRPAKGEPSTVDAPPPSGVG
jgi:hypothetical protein